MFFDDHILPNDAHIVDVRRADAPSTAPVPIGAVYGINLLRAVPLSSIVDRGYFLGAVAAAEDSWRLSGSRRRAIARVLAAGASTTAVGEGAGGGAQAASESESSRLAYVPHAQTQAVTMTSDCAVADDWEGAEEAVEVEAEAKAQAEAEPVEE